MQISKEEVLNIITTQPYGNIEEKWFKKKFPELYQEIQSIKFPENFKWSQKLYHFFHNDFEFNLGLCPVCNKRCKFISFFQGYKKYCSKKCVYLDDDLKIRRTITNNKKYGCNNVFQNEEIKQKSKKTIYKKYGVYYIAQTKKCQEKIKQTNQKRRGVNYPGQSKECQEKMKQTNIKKRGVKNPFQSEECKEKSRQTCQEKYGCNYYNQTKECREKMKQTNIKRHGYEYFSQSPKFAKYHRKRVEYDDLTFDSNWEVEVYKFCKGHNIPCEYQPNISIEYEYEGKNHYYHPDFLINGKIYEVKGDQFFDDTGKMINPYDKESNLFEAKHQCMLQNGVIILRGCDIQKVKNNINIFE